MKWKLVLFSATVCLRLVLFPLVVQVQRNVANMNNHNPEMMRLQQKVNKVETFGLPKMVKQQKTSYVALHV